MSDSENLSNETIRNQQEILMAWLGCAFDCEGTIGFDVAAKKKRYKRTNKPQILPRVSISNTSWKIIEKCCKCADAVGVGYNVTPYKSNLKRRKPVWIFSMVGSKRVGAILPLIMPHLADKLYCAEAIMAFIESRKGKCKMPNSERQYTESELQLVHVTRRNSPENTRATPIDILRSKIVG